MVLFYLFFFPQMKPDSMPFTFGQVLKLFCSKDLYPSKKKLSPVVQI